VLRIRLLVEYLGRYVKREGLTNAPGIPRVLRVMYTVLSSSVAISRLIEEAVDEEFYIKSRIEPDR
jgi:hypothetical protein